MAGHNMAGHTQRCSAHPHLTTAPPSLASHTLAALARYPDGGSRTHHSSPPYLCNQLLTLGESPPLSPHSFLLEWEMAWGGWTPSFPTLRAWPACGRVCRCGQTAMFLSVAYPSPTASFHTRDALGIDSQNAATDATKHHKSDTHNICTHASTRRALSFLAAE
jgi:hypothetical protein